MGCGTNIVPGFNEVNKKIKDPALETKINQLLNKPKYNKKLSKPQPR
jgi:hypothetical protein